MRLKHSGNLSGPALGRRWRERRKRERERESEREREGEEEGEEERERERERERTIKKASFLSFHVHPSLTTFANV